MWADAAKWLAEFPEAVVTAVDADGYPVSVRQSAPRYDPATGRLPVVWPPDLAVAEGPAVVLCHYHDENLWNIKAIQIKGRLEGRADQCVFTTTAFRPPPRSQIAAFWRLAKDMRAAGKRYLAKRGLQRPAVNWDSIRELNRRARTSTRV
jgi:hypothetical protein